MSSFANNMLIFSGFPVKELTGFWPFDPSIERAYFESGAFIADAMAETLHHRWHPSFGMVPQGQLSTPLEVAVNKAILAPIVADVQSQEIAYLSALWENNQLEAVWSRKLSQERMVGIMEESRLAAEANSQLNLNLISIEVELRALIGR